MNCWMTRYLNRQHRAHLEEEGPDLWCGQDFVIPGTLRVHEVYTLMWRWNFGAAGTAKIYTTCLDVLAIE